MHLRLVLALILLVPLASGGTPDDPDWTDPSSDQAVSGGGPLSSVLDSDDFADVDLLAAWVELGNSTTLTIRGAAATSGTTSITAMATATNTSMRFPGDDWNETWVIEITGDTVTSGDASASFEGADLIVELPGLIPGDAVQLHQITRQRSGSSGTPVLAPAQSATDAFTGEARIAQQNLSVVPGAVLDYRLKTGGLNVTLTNTGTHPDVFEVTGHNGTHRLAPGANISFTIEADEPVAVQATSTRGANASVYWAPPPPAVTLTAEKATPPPAAERVAWPEGLAWLTPAATTLGLIEAFGSAAEVTLLAAILLAATLLVMGWMRVATVRVRPEPAVEPDPLPEPGMPLIEATRDMRAVAIPGKPTLVLDSLVHSRDEPLPGEEIDSAITIENKGALGARIHARLVIEDRILGEQTLAVPGRQRVRVTMPWRAGNERGEPVFELYPA